MKRERAEETMRRGMAKKAKVCVEDTYRERERESERDRDRER